MQLPTCIEVKDLIRRAEAALGPLSAGQRTDLILDNFLDVSGVYEARLLLAQCEELNYKRREL